MNMRACLILVLSLLSSAAIASEVTLYFGGISTGDIQQGDEVLDTDNDGVFGLSYAWRYKGRGAKGQGELLLSRSQRQFTSNDAGVDSSFDVTYGHFSGIAFYPQGAYTTIFGLGLGFTQVSADSSAIYPSLSAVSGIRYQVSDAVLFKVEGRVFSTVTDSEDKLFCSGDDCQTFLGSDIYTETQLWAGISYKF